MDCTKIREEIALKVCAIGDSMFKGGLAVIESSIDKEDMEELCLLLNEYDKIYSIDVSKAESVILRELRSVRGDEELYRIFYKEYGNKFPLVFGLTVLGQLEV